MYSGPGWSERLGFHSTEVWFGKRPEEQLLLQWSSSSFSGASEELERVKSQLGSGGDESQPSKGEEFKVLQSGPGSQPLHLQSCSAFSLVRLPRQPAEPGSALEAAAASMTQAPGEATITLQASNNGAI